jgi:hypothetical protein
VLLWNQKLSFRFSIRLKILYLLRIVKFAQWVSSYLHFLGSASETNRQLKLETHGWRTRKEYSYFIKTFSLRWNARESPSVLRYAPSPCGELTEPLQCCRAETVGLYQDLNRNSAAESTGGDVSLLWAQRRHKLRFPFCTSPRSCRGSGLCLWESRVRRHLCNRQQ